MVKAVLSGFCTCLYDCIRFGLFDLSICQSERLFSFSIAIAFFITFIILGVYYPNLFDGKYESSLNLTSGCDSDYIHTCIYNHLLYRVSLSLVLFYALLGAISSISSISTLSSSLLWLLELVILTGIVTGSLFLPNAIFSDWAQTTRVISLFWMIAQGFFIVDLMLDVHEQWMTAMFDHRDHLQYIKALYNISVWIGFSCSFIGLVFLFKDYCGCTFGIIFTVITLVFGIVTTAISSIGRWNSGMLTPSILSAYSVFLCWYAILSQTSCYQSNLSYETMQDDAASIIMTIFTVLTLLYCCIYGSKIVGIFHPQSSSSFQDQIDKRIKQWETTMASDTDRLLGDSDDNDSYSLESGDLSPKIYHKNDAISNPFEAPSTNKRVVISFLYDELIFVNNRRHDSIISTKSMVESSIVTYGSSSQLNRIKKGNTGSSLEWVYFYVIMILSCSFGAMLFTNWGSTSGSPQDSNTTTKNEAIESMWLKISSQWLFLLLYLRALQVSLEDNAMSEDIDRFQL